VKLRHRMTCATGEVLTWSKLVIELSRMPKKRTPVSSKSSSTARSASVMGVTSPKPMVDTVVRDQ